MKTVLVAILCFCLLDASSQSNKIEPGIKLGMGFSSVSPKTYRDYNGQNQTYSSKVTFIGGVKALFPLTNNYGILPEFEILGKGAREGDFYINLKTFYQFNLNGYYRSKGKEGGFIIGGGPFIAFPDQNNWDVKGKTDAGINMIAGYQVPIGFSFELHFMKSFTAQFPNNAFNENQEVKYSNWGFTVGYFF